MVEDRMFKRQNAKGYFVVTKNVGIPGTKVISWFYYGKPN